MVHDSLDWLVELVTDLPQHPVVDPGLSVLAPFQPQGLCETLSGQLQQLLVGGACPWVDPRQDEQPRLCQDL